MARPAAALITNAALAVLLAAVVSGCAEPTRPPQPYQAAMEAEPDLSDEQNDFRDDLLSDIDKIDTFLQKTQRGNNPSEFTLGWFVMILLNELSSQDQALFDHLHANGMNVELYLRGPFQSNPQREIAALEALAHTGNRNIRMAARWSLEALAHIPESKDSAETQALARKDLAAALGRLKGTLMRVAAEAGPKSEP